MTPDYEMDPAFDDVPELGPGDIVFTKAPMLALAEVLPTDFPLPTLTRFVPDVSIKTRAEEATAYANSIDVTVPGGLQLADAAGFALRGILKDIEAHFAEPTDIANRLHKRLTGLRSEWMQPGDDAVRALGQRVAREHSRLQTIAADERRRAQAEADRQAREQRERDVESAKAAGAPPVVVEQMAAAAKVATAPPVPVVSTAPAMAHTTVTKTWKARITGSPADAPPNPSTAELTATQQAHVLELVKAIAAGQQPLTLIDLNWSLLNARAKAEKSTLAVPGIESFEEQGARAKAGRRGAA